MLMTVRRAILDLAVYILRHMESLRDRAQRQALLILQRLDRELLANS
jgi:hypothetical protein